MPEKLLLNLVQAAYIEKKRLVVPLIGFPGIRIIGSTIKLAQHNCKEHFKVIKAISETFETNVIFPLMDLSVEANALDRYSLFPKEDSATVPKDEFSLSDFNNLKNINISFDSLCYTGAYTLAALLMGAEDAAISTIFRPDELH